MLGIARVARATFLFAGALGVVGATSTAGAQVRRQPAAAAAQPAPPPTRPSILTRPPYNPNAPRIGYGYGAAPPQAIVRHHLRQSPFFPQTVIVYPVPVGVGYYPSGCGASVCDVNGAPVLQSFDEQERYRQQQSPATVPDLSGSPYVALDGGAILVDFGDGYRRTIPSCAAQQAAMTPDGQPRTIFYSTPTDGLVLRRGERGNVVGTPVAGVPMCYGLDQYGRVALSY